MKDSGFFVFVGRPRRRAEVAACGFSRRVLMVAPAVRSEPEGSRFCRCHRQILSGCCGAMSASAILCHKFAIWSAAPSPAPWVRFLLFYRICSTPRGDFRGAGGGV